MMRKIIEKGFVETNYIENGVSKPVCLSTLRVSYLTRTTLVILESSSGLVKVRLITIWFLVFIF